jgi:hypothetical protein
LWRIKKLKLNGIKTFNMFNNKRCEHKVGYLVSLLSRLFFFLCGVCFLRRAVSLPRCASLPRVTQGFVTLTVQLCFKALSGVQVQNNADWRNQTHVSFQDRVSRHDLCLRGA